MPVEVPKIGSRIRVTTMYPNTYAYRGKDDNYVTYVREGDVVKSVFNEPFSFAVYTGDPQYPVSEYSAKSQHVVKIEYIRGSGEMLDDSKKAWKIKSKDKVYLVLREGGKYSCTCKGFEFRRDCRHIGMVGK